MRFILVLALSLGAIGCGGLKIPNEWVCADGGKHGAFCAMTRSNSEQRLSKAQWDKVRVGWFCMHPDSFGNYQKFIELACNQNKNCIDDATRKAANLYRELRNGI